MGTSALTTVYPNQHAASRVRRILIAVLCVMLLACARPVPAGARASADLDAYSDSPFLLYVYNRDNPRPYKTPAPPSKPGRPLRRAPELLRNRSDSRSRSAIWNKSVLFSLGSVVVLAVGSEWLSEVLGLPDASLPVIAGLLLGPVSGVLDPDELFGNLLLPGTSLMWALLLFGHATRARMGPGIRIAAPRIAAGVLLGLGLACVFAVVLVDTNLSTAVLAATAITLTAFSGHQRDAQEASPLARFGESAGVIAVVLGTTIAVLAFEITLFGTSSYSHEVVPVIVNTIWTALVIGLLGAGLIGLLVRSRRIGPRWRTSAMLSMVMLAFTIADQLQADAGFLAVLVMGLAVTNWRITREWFDPTTAESWPSINAAVLVLILAARCRVTDLEVLGVGAVVFVVFVLLVAVPCATLTASRNTRWAWGDRLLLAWMTPGGAVAAGLATIYGLRLAEARVAHTAPLASLTILGILMSSVLAVIAVPLDRRQRARAAAEQQA